MATLLDAFEDALKDNKQTETVDAAVIEAGRTIARAIDKISADTEATPTEVTKALYLTPHLVSILRELLATPAARRSVGLAAGEKKKASRLNQIQGGAKQTTAA